MKDLKKAAASAIDALSRHGADMGSCTVRYTETREFNVDGGQFSLFRTLFDTSVSITAFQGGRKGQGAVNRIDDESIDNAVQECMASAASAQPDDCWDLAAGEEPMTIVEGCVDPDLDKFFSRLQELMEDIKAKHPLILMEQLIACHKKVHTVYRNTKGAEFDTTNGYYTVSLMYSAHEGDATSSFFGSDVTVTGLDMPLIQCGSFERDLADVEKQIHTVSPGEKFEGTVVFTPGSMLSMLYSALGTFAGDTAILSGTSLWKDSLGEAVADERITVGMRPWDERMVVGQRFTGDGFKAEDYNVIENGVLKSFMLSLYVANKTGLPRAKNSDFDVVMEPGDKSLADIISGIKRGLLIGRLSGGEPSANGEFSMVAKNSFLIEDGKLTGAVSETMINGNLQDMLKNLVAISSETACDGSSVLPWAAFGGVTVSGKE